MKITFNSKYIFITLTYMTLIAVGSLKPGSPEHPETGGFSMENLNNFLHPPAYAILTYSLAHCFRRINKTTLAASFAIAFGYGVLMEYGQSFVPHRYPSLSDVCLNTVGIVVALLIVRRKTLGSNPVCFFK